VNGLPPWTSLTGPIAANAAPVASTLWFAGYINDPNDFSSVASDSAQYQIFPQDFSSGSTVPSAYAPGVQQGQFEVVFGMFAGDGQFHIYSRNQPGSTAPANMAWPAGSVIAQSQSPNYGTLEVADNHFNDIDLPSNSNWAVDCNDATDMICGEAVVGSIPPGEPGRGRFLSGECGAGAGMHVPGLRAAGECECDARARTRVVSRPADR
jgi:hypothetical protein